MMEIHLHFLVKSTSREANKIHNANIHVEILILFNVTDGEPCNFFFSEQYIWFNKDGHMASLYKSSHHLQLNLSLKYLIYDLTMQTLLFWVSVDGCFSLHSIRGEMLWGDMRELDKVWNICQ